MDNNLFARLENREGYAKTNQKAVLNPYVNFHKHTNTQTLQDVLVAESIQMRGVEAYYLRRELVNLDLFFGEDTESRFNKAYKIAIYINSFENYDGQREFFSKFQMQVNDELDFSINPHLFQHQTDGKDPIEGDLLYFPMDNSLFELVWVEPRDPFYQVGQNAIRRINAQKFVYSGEEIKPELQKTNVDFDFDASDLELEPVRRLDGKADITNIDYEEDQSVHDQVEEFAEDFVVVNGRGVEYNNGFEDEDETEDPNSPFSDF